MGKMELQGEEKGAIQCYVLEEAWKVFVCEIESHTCRFTKSFTPRESD